MPVTGSLNHLRESRSEIDSSWAALKDSLHRGAQADEKPLVEAMDKNFAAVGAVLGKIEQAYSAKNNAQLTEVLEADWASLHKGFIKPMQSSGAAARCQCQDHLRSRRSPATARMSTVAVAMAVAADGTDGGARRSGSRRSITRSLRPRRRRRSRDRRG